MAGRVAASWRMGKNCGAGPAVLSPALHLAAKPGSGGSSPSPQYWKCWPSLVFRRYSACCCQSVSGTGNPVAATTLPDRSSAALMQCASSDHSIVPMGL